MREELQKVLDDYLEAIDNIKSRESVLLEEVDRNLGSEGVKEVVNSLIEHVKQRPEEIQDIDRGIKQENIENMRESARSGLVFSEKSYVSDILENQQYDGLEKVEKIGRVYCKMIPELRVAHEINDMVKQHEKQLEFFKEVEEMASRSSTPNIKQFASELFEKDANVGVRYGINNHDTFVKEYDKELDRRDYQSH